MAIMRLNITVQGVPDTFDPTQLLDNIEAWLQAKGKPYEISNEIDPDPVATKREWTP